MKIEDLYRIYLESTGICTDSRNCIPGSLFFAIRGEKFDGNKFAIDALKKGCSFCIIDDKSQAAQNGCILVDNVLVILQKLANYHRKQLKIPIIAITGSNGKTTTKELCLAVLSKKYRVFATQGNLNNHIGVPLSILSIKDEEMSIIEMGANHEGEIKNLCSIAEPGFGLITNIGLAHLEGFGSPEGVLKAKAELYDYLKLNSGKAFYNAASPVLSGLIRNKLIDAIPYGEHSQSLCKGKIINNERFISVELQFKDNTKLYFDTWLVGSYNLDNIIAAAAVGKYFGVSSEDIKEAIKNYVPRDNRSQYLVSLKNKIILDAYNANPSSMESSILNFLSMTDPSEKLMILGDMLELGLYSDEEHQKIVSLLIEKGISEVFFVGPCFLKTTKNSGYRSFERTEDLLLYLQKCEIKNRLVFIKGSRGIKLEQVLDYL